MMSQNTANGGQSCTSEGGKAPRSALPSPNASTTEFVDSWRLELFSALFGIALIAVLCGIVSQYHGESVPTFGSVFNTNLTLNFVISLILSIAVPMLMVPVVQCVAQLKWIWFLRPRPLDHLETFDQASRGLSGSAEFLWKMRARPFASVGAFLTIVQLVVGPLAQNAVLYPLEAVSYNNSIEATVPVVHQWHEPPAQEGAMIKTPSPHDPSSVDPQTVGDIYRGIFSGTSRYEPLQPFCPTGNCTIGPYRTLGICSRSIDVLSHIKWQPQPMGYYLPGVAFIPASMTAGDWYYMKMKSAASVPPGNTEPEEWIRYGTPLHFNASFSTEDTASLIADVFVIYVNYGIPKTPVIAIEFLLEWCVQTLYTTMENGKANSQVLETYKDFKVVYREHSFADPIPELENLESEPYLKASVPPNSSDIHGINGLEGFHGYSVQGSTHYNYQRYFQTLLNGSVHAWNLTDVHYFADSDVAKAMYYLYSPSHQGDKEVPMTGREVLDFILNNLVLSMTNEKRKRSSLIVRGVAWRQHLVVRVQWGFLVVPVVFMALCVGFSAATLCYQRYSAASASPPSDATSGQRRPSIHAWRTSSLAVLHALEPRLQEKLGTMVKPSALQKQAEKLTVSLGISSEGTRGWKLREVEEESGGSETEEPHNDMRSDDDGRDNTTAQSDIRTETSQHVNVHGV